MRVAVHRRDTSTDIVKSWLGMLESANLDDSFANAKDQCRGEASVPLLYGEELAFVQE